jgi:hypothetical protein
MVRPKSGNCLMELRWLCGEAAGERGSVPSESRLASSGTRLYAADEDFAERSIALRSEAAIQVSNARIAPAMRLAISICAGLKSRSRCDSLSARRWAQRLAPSMVATSVTPRSTRRSFYRADLRSLTRQRA